jgi:hypothetical protein
MLTDYAYKRDVRCKRQAQKKRQEESGVVGSNPTSSSKKGIIVLAYLRKSIAIQRNKAKRHRHA